MENESTSNLANIIADFCGIYTGCTDPDNPKGCKNFDKEHARCCRGVFVNRMKERIIKAVENDNKS